MPPTDAEIEAGAKALYEHCRARDDVWPWELLVPEGSDGQRAYRRSAEAVLAAAEAVRPEPEEGVVTIDGEAWIVSAGSFTVQPAGHAIAVLVPLVPVEDTKEEK